MHRHSVTALLYTDEGTISIFQISHYLLRHMPTQNLMLLRIGERHIFQERQQHDTSGWEGDSALLLFRPQSQT